MRSDFFQILHSSYLDADVDLNSIFCLTLLEISAAADGESEHISVTERFDVSSHLSDMFETPQSCVTITETL